jgi:hypothetical protein
MKIDFKKIKIYLISPGTREYKNRLLTVFSRLVDEGYTNIRYFKSVPDINKIISLTKTIVEIFKIELLKDEPFIILEDDCNTFYKYDSIEVPNNYDLLYLGLSKWGYSYPIDTLMRDLSKRPKITAAIFSNYNNRLIKIHSMTGGHAILYNSREYLQDFISNIENLSDHLHKFSQDLLFATLQKDYYVYGLKKPLFYQDECLGGQEEVTKFEIF